MLELLFNIVAELEDCNVLKRDSNKCFLVNIVKFLRTPTLKNTCEQLFCTSNHKGTN